MGEPSPKRGRYDEDEIDFINILNNFTSEELTQIYAALDQLNKEDELTHDQLMGEYFMIIVCNALVKNFFKCSLYSYLTYTIFIVSELLEMELPSTVLESVLQPPLPQPKSGCFITRLCLTINKKIS